MRERARGLTGRRLFVLAVFLLVGCSSGPASPGGVTAPETGSSGALGSTGATGSEPGSPCGNPYFPW